MNKFLIFLCLFFPQLICPQLSYAQQEMSMRSMAVAQLYEYGQAIYDRGDYSQAAKVFSRILAMDPEHAGALDYAKELKKKGEFVIVPVKPVSSAATPVITKTPQATQQEPTETTDSIPTDEDLKQYIEKTDQAVDRLQSDIAQLRTQIFQTQKDAGHKNGHTSPN